VPEDNIGNNFRYVSVNTENQKIILMVRVEGGTVAMGGVHVSVFADGEKRKE
jgi:hypothetical protein